MRPAACALGFDPDASRAAVAAVQPLIDLYTSSIAASNRNARPRALEFGLRAVALAETALPAGSLVTAELRAHVIVLLPVQAAAAEMVTTPDAMARMQLLYATAWRDDPRLVATSRQNLEALRRRWRAGTLAAPCAEEHAFLLSTLGADARLFGARLFLNTAQEVLQHWPPDKLDAAALAHLRDAIAAVLEADARGELIPAVRPEGLDDDPAQDVLCFIRELLGGNCMNQRTPQQRIKLARDLLTPTQAHALQAMTRRLLPLISCDERARERARAEMVAMSSAVAAATATDVARHGLQRCALPSCAAQEPAPRTYKRCSRCAAAFYCCVAHQRQDGKRHKREDGCKKPE